MDTRVEKTLSDIVKSYGVEVIQNPRQVEGLLRDFCGDLKREINLLVFALKEGVPSDLLKEKDQVQIELLINRLVKRLVDHLALEESAARWAISSWKAVITQAGDGKSIEDEENAFQVDIVSNPYATRQGTFFLGNIKEKSEITDKLEEQQIVDEDESCTKAPVSSISLEEQLSDFVRDKKWGKVVRISRIILEQKPYNRKAIEALKKAEPIVKTIENYKKRIRGSVGCWNKIKLVRAWLKLEPSCDEAESILNDSLAMAPSVDELKKGIQEASQIKKWTLIQRLAEQWILLEPSSIEAHRYLQQAKKERKAGKVLSKPAGVRSSRPQSTNSQTKSNSIYMGNLPFTMSDNDLWKLASQIDNGKHLEDAYIIRDQSTGKSRGFGFIVLKNSKPSARSMDLYIQQLKGKVFKGRPLQARCAYPKSSS